MMLTQTQRLRVDLCVGFFCVESMSRRIRSARLRRGFCARFFLKAILVFLQGVLQKLGGKTWYLGGQFVVECVVNVVS